MKFSDDVRAEAAVAKPKEKKGWNQKKKEGKKKLYHLTGRD